MLLPIEQAAAKADPECAAGGVKVAAGASPATVTVNDTTTSTSVQVVVTITGTTFAITPVDSGVTLTGATWCLKASTKTQNGTGTTGASTIMNGKNVPQKIGYLVVYGVTSQAPDPFPAARALCESSPVPGTFELGTSETFYMWACNGLSTADTTAVTAKINALSDRCLHDGGIDLDLDIRSVIAAACDKF